MMTANRRTEVCRETRKRKPLSIKLVRKSSAHGRQTLHQEDLSHWKATFL